MMAAAGPPVTSGFLSLLETLEDGAASPSEQTDAYLTIANRLSGEDGRQFLPPVEKHFSRLGQTILVHVSGPSAELSQAALQALGFCVYHSHVVSGLCESFAASILSALCSLVTKSSDKNTCTRALWVISKQSFPTDVVSKRVPSILGTLESVWTREDVQSVVMEHEALNVIIRMLEQVPASMGDGAVRWAKLVIPLVVHSASKVRLRAAAALEMGMPLLLDRQADVAAVIEPMMSTKLIPELQKLYKSKNETNVLKLWPLFVKLLGKLLHRGGPFINSLLHLEELGFRSSSASIKKIAFIAWKSLIDNFALNPDILCSTKRIKLLMQPLTSINVKTEALLLTKVEVWWYLAVQLGPNLSSNFEQVSVPLLQCTIGTDSILSTPSRATANGAVPPGTPKTGFGGSANASLLSVNSSVQLPSSFPSIQLLGLEMLLHYFLGPEVGAAAARNKLVLSLEPLKQPLLTGSSSFAKHAAVLVSSVRDAFTSVGRDAPECLLTVIWTSLVRFVSLTIESGSKKERQGCEVLTLTLQALQSVVASEALPADKVLALLKATVNGVPPRVLGSASYQVGKMDVLNGTPALFLLLLLFDSSVLPAYVQDERFFHCLQTLVGCGLSGPASPLAFAEAVLGAVGRSAPCLQSKEQLCRMWSAVVNPLTDTITQSNEVNQGDALEHNFSAVHSALMLPVTHFLNGAPLPQASQKSMLSSWSKLYRVFARCSALVVTAEENVCCEELSAKMAAAIDREALSVPAAGGAVACMLQVMAECVDFSPYTPQFQQKLKSPRTPVGWMRKRSRALGNLSSFQSLLVQSLEVHLKAPDACEATASALLAVVSALFGNLVIATAVQEALTSLMPSLTLLYGEAAAGEPLQGKLEKLLADLLGCLQTRTTLAYDADLLALLSPLLCVLFPHKVKQIRTAITHFWNATFAHSVGLCYPEEIRPILSQVKQRTPIILPGFEVVTVSDGLDSSESSQMETRISGIPVSSAGTKDARPDPKETSAPKTPKPVSTKLDFGSPKPPRRDLLEEEASMDFVFIPPESKERVLTEHQKEVKRTRRVDIPAMYNTLDASLDTAAFSQFSQSQDTGLDQQPTGQTLSVPAETPAEVDGAEQSLVVEKETQDHLADAEEEEEVLPPAADVPAEDGIESKDAESKDSPNTSASSDLVLGTPQKPGSRRQSFITLEKYPEGKPGVPSPMSSFTGPLAKASNSQDLSKPGETFASLELSSETSVGPNSETSESGQTKTELPESPRRPKDSRRRSEPVRLTERLPERLPSDAAEDEDVIPDTQTQQEIGRLKTASTLEDVASSSQEEDYEASQEASQSSDEPRRSGRSRVRPLLPGEDPKDRDAKSPLLKRTRSGDGAEAETDSANSRPNTRSQQTAEEITGRLRSRSQRDESRGKPRKKAKLGRSSEDVPHKAERRRRSSQTDSESLSQGRRSRSSKAATETAEDSQSKKDSETVCQSPPAHGNSQETGPAGQDRNEKEEDPLLDASTAATEGLSQESEAGGQGTPPPNESQEETRSTVPEAKQTTAETDDLSQEDSAVITPLSSEGPRRSRRSRTTPETAQSEDKNKDSKRQSRSNSQTEVRGAGRTTRSRGQEDSQSLTPESSQSLDASGPQGRGTSSTRRSAPASVTGTESSGVKDGGVIVRKRGRKPRASFQDTSTAGSQVDGSQVDASQEDESQLDESQQNASQKADPESLEAKNGAGLEDGTQTRPLLDSESLQGPGGAKEELQEETPMEEDVPSVSEGQPPEDDDTSDQRDSNAKDEEDASAEVPAEDTPKDCLSAVDTVAPPSEPSETLQGDKAGKEGGPAEILEANCQEDPVAPAEEDAHDGEEEVSKGVVEEQKEEELQDASHQDTEDRAEKDVAPLQGKEEDLDASTAELQDEPTSEAAEDDGGEGTTTSETASKAPAQDSPVKQRDLEAVMAAEVGQSPGDGRTKGAWSPSASPSTSILKKSQKRQLEADSPSPLVKSRRVSFANPIQQQETADDIDRRSPAVRTSSPRRSRVSGVPQPKLVTTPTKGLGVLSPRSLHSPGFKSSKKCLISEMSQEPRPVSKDCICPALVGCSAPVEAVLPQISFNMWSRGFGQLIRARNIKTVGDLSALTPSEVKTLPVRSPKVSNVKKALKIYQQQRNGRGSSDELKSFAETEMMTSEVEETSAPQTAEEEDKTPAESLAVAMADEAAPEQRGVDGVDGEDGEDGEDAAPGEGPLPELQALSCRMTPPELRRRSPRQLADIHERLGELMRRVVVELQERLQQADD